jgi:7-carboxy-7-deazaguanine synthase
MKVIEIFYSLQGEGRLAGVPSVFIRLAGCPLRCRWCDTKYAWSETAGREMSIDQIEKEISAFDTSYLVITGGEPMYLPQLNEFVTAIARPQRHITIETSGIRYIPDLPCNLMSISPKLSNSTPNDPEMAIDHESKRFNLKALRSLLEGYEFQLKFVVDLPADLDKIARCLDRLGAVDPYKVYLMPQAATRKEYLEKSQWLAQTCLKTGFSFSPRLQVMLWDNQPGR